MAEILRMIQSVPNQKFLWRIEAHVPNRITQVLGNVLMKECADRQ